MSDPDFQAIDQRIVAAADPAAAVESNLHALCNEIGPRFAGTDGYRKAAVYMQDRLEAYGLENAHLEPFEIAAFRRGSQPARVMADGFEAAAYGLPYGAATGPEGLKTTVIHVGGGSESNLADRADQLSGCLVLTTGPGRVRQEIYAQCVELGAGGLIRSNPIEGDHLHTGSVTHGQMGPIPAVSVSQKTGEALRQRVETGHDQLCLTVGGHCETVTTWNVVG
ncbi:MAG: hypothetical protein R3336_02220, partial [Phycisphaeraceae bacterium]|nr:hypothetical protein [Phycisphaeraceae bacterium]